MLVSYTTINLTVILSFIQSETENNYFHSHKYYKKFKNVF